MEKNINRLKVVLAEKNLPNKWLVEHLGVSPTTVSKWVTNFSQPSLEMLIKMDHLCLECTKEEVFMILLM